MVPAPTPLLTLETRRAARVVTMLRAQLITRGGIHPCVIGDLSPGGALLIDGPALAEGESALLQSGLLDILVEAIRWAPGELAVRFLEDPLGAEPEEDLEAQQRARINRRFFRIVLGEADDAR